MDPLLSLRPQMARQVKLLGNASTRLSLMSVAIPSLRLPATVALVLASVGAADVTGMLDDGSVGIFALRDNLSEEGSGIEDRLLPRLQAALRSALAPDFASHLKIWFRAIHRWSAEVEDAEEMMASLYHASPTVVGISPQGTTPATILPFRPLQLSRLPIWS